MILVFAGTEEQLAFSGSSSSFCLPTIVWSFRWQHLNSFIRIPVKNIPPVIE